MMHATTLSKVENEIIRAVSVERLMRDTEAIARWVRLSGSEDERQAFEYVAGALRVLGLEPTLYLSPGYISLPQRAKLRVHGEELAAITHSMAISTPPAGLHVPLVYVGNGTPQDYASRDVHGTAVLVDGMAMPGKVEAAEAAGAAAAIFANRDEHVHEMIVSTVWGSPTLEERARLPRMPVVSIGRAAGDRLRKALAQGQPVDVDLVTEVTTRWTEIPTLVAQVNGVAEPEKFVLLSGHVDSWHYGAMDNGSANATMLETLRVVLPYRDTFRRGLRLAFWSGHSHGRYAGSSWYADTFWEDLHNNCVVHINVDSVGGQNATVLTEAHAMAETRPVAAEVIGALTGVEFTGTRFGRAGDQSFQAHGIPSLFMSLSEQPLAEGDSASGFAELVGAAGAKSGGLGWWWHTPEDTVDKIDPALLLRDAQIYAAVTYHFLAQELLPLDMRASAEDLLGHLRMWRQQSDGRFDLDQVVARAEEVAALAAQVQDGLRAVDGRVSNEVARRLNAIIMKAEHALVRLNYVQTEPYAHDRAASEPPVPLLEPLTQLLATAPGSDADYELQTLLVRRRNRIQQELAEAGEALREGLAALASVDT
jgi:Peptidase family M28/PA domain